jgi:hypothetical protein
LVGSAKHLRTERFSLTFTTKTLGERFRGRLVRATEDGEAFDVTTGLPDSMAEAKTAVSLYAFVLAYRDMKWTPAAAKTRASMTQTLMTALPAYVRDTKGDRALRRCERRCGSMRCPRRAARSSDRVRLRTRLRGSNERPCRSRI